MHRMAVDKFKNSKKITKEIKDDDNDSEYKKLKDSYKKIDKNDSLKNISNLIKSILKMMFLINMNHNYLIKKLKKNIIDG